MPSPSLKYACHQGFDPLWRELEGEFLVYDRGSGNIHCFDGVTAELVRLLRREPRSLQEIEAQLAARLDVEADEALARYIDNALRELARREIVCESSV